MKKMISLLGAVVTVFTSSFHVGAQTGYPDSEKLAQAFLLRAADHYQISFGGSAQVSNTWLYINVDAGLNQDLFVTNLMVNGTNIPLSKPLPGIPLPDSGFRGVSCSVNAYDKNGLLAADGYTNMQNLAQGDAINITLFPEFPPTAVPLPAGLDRDTLNVSVDGATGWGWSYDPATGILTIYVWDSTGASTFSVKDGNGTLLAHGQIPFFRSSGVAADTNSVLSIKYAGNVVSLPMQNSVYKGGTYNSASGLKFDGNVVRDGTNAAAKVISIPDLNKQSLLYLSVYSQDGPIKVEVREWSADGAMNLVPCSYSADDYGNVTVITRKYINKAVITVLPLKNPNGKFGVWAYRTN